MAGDHVKTIRSIAEKYKKDPARLMDVLLDIKKELGYFSEDTIGAIAEAMNMPRVKVRDTLSFYAFFPREKTGEHEVLISKSVVEWMKGGEELVKAFEKELGVSCGETTKDDKVSLGFAECIGMSDQAPSAIVDGVPVGNLMPGDAKKVIEAAKKGNVSDLPGAKVAANLKKEGPVIFAPMDNGAALDAAIKMSPDDVIAEVEKSGLRGRGGAGFPTGRKWKFCRMNKSDVRYVVCNADEGEPGTFKDRVILSEKPDLLFEGMTVAGYALDAKEGILYLRGEYAYMKPALDKVLEERRKNNLLGAGIKGKKGFDFDIRIQLGAGAYVCGEESALLESAEGKRGAPRERPPFPVEKGYMDKPTSVNNVETLCAAARVMEKGADWFSAIGTKDSAGTKLISVSGDCKEPGVYEIDYGTTVADFLKLCGAEKTKAVQIGGPSGRLIAPKDFKGTISFEQFPTGGSLIVFDESRDILEYMRQFMDFFTEESCGWCAPCRTGTSLLLVEFEKVLDGRGTQADLDNLKKLGELVKTMSRCGLGQTAANPILTSMESFPELYKAIIKPDEYIGRFEFDKAVKAGEEMAGRKSELEEAHS